jgi:toxin ParE1/3/4
VPDSLVRDEIQPGLRSIHVARHGRRGRHLVLYRIAEGETIDILRMLHDSMDIGRHVAGDPMPGGS